MAGGTGNRFYIEPAKADISPVLQGIGSLIQQNREETTKKQNYDSLMNAYQSGKTEDVIKLLASNPDLAPQLNAMIGFKDEETEKNYADTVRMLSLTSDPAAREKALIDRIEFVNERNGTPVQSVMALDQLTKDPEGFEKSLELEILRTQGKDAYKAYRANKGIGEENQQKQINVLRKSISAAENTNNVIKQAQRKIESVGRKGTAASDMALVFSFMKILDPGSTVREGEYASARDATGVPSKIMNLYNNILKGTILTPAQREDFLNQAASLADAQMQETDNQILGILEQADQDNISRERVFGKRRLLSLEKRLSKIENAPDSLPDGVSEEDILVTMESNNMTREQVIGGLNAR